MSKSDMYEIDYPASLHEESRQLLLGVLIDRDEARTDIWHLVDRAARVNDDEFISDSEREYRLTDMFAVSGIELSFYGEYLGGFLELLQDEMIE